MTDAYVPGHGDDRYGVDRYELDLRYRVPTNRLEGTATVRAVAREPLTSVSFDLSRLRATRVEVDGVRAPRVRHREHKLVVPLPSPVEAGQAFTVVIDYRGAPGPRTSRWGTVGWEELEDGVIVASQPTGASTWFPCNDRVDDRAAYDIRIAADRDYRVVCNGELVAERTVGGSTHRRFVQPEPTSAYLATVEIGRYVQDDVDLAGVPGRLSYPRRIRSRVRADFGALPAMMACFTERFGAYPFAGYDVVVTADDLEIPLESQGGATFGANHADGEGGSERLVAHELAHQWFGNSLGLERWRDIWLNEGFACYAEWIWSEARGGPSADELARRHHDVLRDLPQDLVLSDPGADLMFDDRVYKRGALTLHALRLTIGDEAFGRLLRTWAEGNRHRTVTTEAFRAHAVGFGGPGTAGLLDAWLDATALPGLPAAPSA